MHHEQLQAAQDAEAAEQAETGLKPRSEAELERQHLLYPDGAFTHRIRPRGPQDAYPGVSPRYGMPFTRLG